MQGSEGGDGIVEASAAVCADDACECGVRAALHGVDGAERAKRTEGERDAEETDG